jgi:hypothetical protein
MPKIKGGGPKGRTSRDDTPTPAPKHAPTDREPSPEAKRPKLTDTSQEDISDAPDVSSGSLGGKKNATMEEIMMDLVDDEGSDFDFDSDDEKNDEAATEEEIRDIIVKIGKLPKNVGNVGELRGLLLQLPPGQLLKQLKSWTAIIAATPSVGSFPIMKTWLQSELFKEHLMYLLKGYILPREVETQSRTRGDDFNTVMNIISNTKRRKNWTLHKTNIDRTHWEYCDWLASTLERIFEANELDCNGLFEGADVSDERKYVVYFAAIRQALSDGSKSRRDRLWSLIAITDEEKQEILKIVPKLADSFAEVRQ